MNSGYMDYEYGPSMHSEGLMCDMDFEYGPSMHRAGLMCE
jgi:hypothetical protein